MSRADFLSKRWKAYPIIIQEMKAWQMGRVQEVNSHKLVLQKNYQQLEIDISQAKSQTYETLGPSIGCENIILGDVVAWNGESLFLLSPNISESYIILDDSLSRWSDFQEKVRQFFCKKGFCRQKPHILWQTPELTIILIF